MADDDSAGYIYGILFCICRVDEKEGIGGLIDNILKERFILINMAQFELLKYVLVFFGFYLILWIIMFLSLYLSLLTAKKLRFIKIKKIYLKHPANITFQTLGLHYISTVISFSIVFSNFNKYVEIAVILLHMIITIFIIFYLIWLIEKVYKIKFRKAFVIYFFSGFFTTIFFFGIMLIYEGIKYILTLL